MINHITTINGHKVARTITSAEEFLNLRDSSSQIAALKAIREEGNIEAKHRLVQFNYSCLPNEDGTLKGAKRLATSVGMDIDHIAPEQMEAVKLRILSCKSQLGLLMLERSARCQGYHLVFRRRQELNQEENLKWASQLLDVAYDACAKDITRVFFASSATTADLIYYSKELFETAECVMPVAEEPVAQASAVVGNYLGFEFPEIIQTYWNLYNKGQEPVEGNRNVLTYELALNLRHICDYDLQKLFQIIPNYWGETGVDEWRKVIANANAEPRRGMPFRMRQVMNRLEAGRKTSASGQSLATPPPMPKRLPPLLRLLSSKVPAEYRAAVCESVFPALGAHLHGVKFLYNDAVLREATFMSLLVAPFGSGKSCVNQPIDHIMADIKQRDDINRQREQEWKESNKRKSANQPKNPRPKDICVQCLMPDMTNAAFVQHLIDNEANGERYCFSRMDEIEMLNQFKVSGKNDAVTQLIRLAFDNALYGQERVSTESVSGVAHVRWNWNASTTPLNALHFFRNALNDGTLSRLSICTILRNNHSNAIKTKNNRRYHPVYGTYDDDFDRELKPYIDRLSACNGIIENKKISKFIQLLADEFEDRADLYESEAYRILSYRANVIAHLKAMVLYVAHNYTWTKEMEEYVRWSEQMDLWCKMNFFGKPLESQMEEEEKLQLGTPQNLLALMPEEFSYEQYCQIRQREGKSGDGRNTLRTWKSRGFIGFDDTTKQYVKLKQIS